MHPNQTFRKTPQTKNIEFARKRSFGTLAINADKAPLLSHIPFQLSEDGEYLEAHLVRSNPILRVLSEPVAAVISVMGPDSYISPDWYEIDDQVPTWNYSAVHLRGQLRKLPQQDLRGVIDRLSDDMEARLLPKPIWKTDKMDEQVLSKMMRMIVPVTMDVEAIEGTWKLSQNKTDDVRLRAAEEVGKTDIGMETQALSDMMKNPGAL